MAGRWRETCGLTLLAALCTLDTACAYRYANVYVNAVRKSTHTSVPMDFYNGQNGLHLGETPATITLKRRSTTKNPVLSVLVRGGIDGCPTYWQIVGVENWGKSAQEAGDANKKNEVLFVVNDEDVTCNR